MTEHPYRASDPRFAPPPPKLSRLAIVAFILACLFFVPLSPLIGGILGIAATVRIARRRHELCGSGLAIAAIPVGFATFFLIQGLIAAIAIPSFITYVRRAKATEAREGLRRIADGARDFHLTTRRFPRGKTGWVPAVGCCEQPSQPRCAADSEAWSAEPWRSLGFTGPGGAKGHYFQWRYTGVGEGKAARFFVEARADLDCDGIYSSYRLEGRVGSTGEVRTTTRRRRRLE